MPNRDPSPSVLWFRRDLRLADNIALQSALETGGPVICLYIRAPGDSLAGANGAAQAWWLHHSLAALDRSLRARGNRLLTLTGDPRHLVEWVATHTGAARVFWNRRYDGPGREMDREIAEALSARGVQVASSPGFLLHEPSLLKTGQGRHFSVYTPFWKALEKSYSPPEEIPPPPHIPSGDFGLDGETLESWNLLPRRPNWAASFESHWHPGEDSAQALLKSFLKNSLAGYADGRDIPDLPQTSRLSPHLALGEISPHAVWRRSGALSERPEDVLRFRKELVWRDFAWHTLFHNPRLAEIPLDRKFDAFPWQGTMARLAAWKRGRTGYPIVDAGLRELWHTGTMHNRVRMIAASFLVKDLLVDWREGEGWFRDTLVDADAASNAFNWQWVAGCGADASPFFRIFNPVAQGEKFDPEGAYVKRWCPELSGLPPKYVHRPSAAPEDILEQAGIRLGSDYPHPVVDHGRAREEALEAFRSMRQGASGD